MQETRWGWKAVLRDYVGGGVTIRGRIAKVLGSMQGRQSPGGHGPRGGTKVSRVGSVTRQNPSHLQVLIQLHFVPDHSHIQLILKASKLQAASTVRLLQASHSQQISTRLPGPGALFSHCLLQSLHPFLPLHCGKGVKITPELVLAGTSQELPGPRLLRNTSTRKPTQTGLSLCCTSDLNTLRPQSQFVPLRLRQVTARLP
jgi:hypothetical protein